MPPSTAPHYGIHLHLRGQVQGVGFRPLVYRLARAAGLKGSVSNGADGVHIRLACEEAGARHFLEQVLAALPEWARVASVTVAPDEGGPWPDFRIVASETRAAPDLLISPDRNPCPECRAEIRDPANRRYAYPFTTCLHCGPRYGILTALPYDRERTTMAPFGECPACRAEYHDPEGRRFHAQTNSCPDCRIPLYWTDAQGRALPGTQDALPALAAAAIREGQIVAVKGAGGYLLLADAARAPVLRTLRQRKHRPAKPFALMYPDLSRLQEDLHANAAETALLTSASGPIVLLRPRPGAAERLALGDIAPGLGHLGAMLPSTPLLDVLLMHLGGPVVATSGNLSGGAILHEDEEARMGLAEVADRFLYFPRAIVTPQDDSVLRVVPGDTRPLILRRARGLAPAFHPHREEEREETLLALGAHMKATVAIRHRGHTHISPYLGHLEGFETRERYQAVTRQLLDLLGARPTRILTDAHPGYFSHQWGRELGQAWGVPVETCYHHEAHLAALLAEHGRMDRDADVLGLIWDGAGLGEDGHIWGGECLLRRGGRTLRAAHFAPFPVLMGDKMAREPRLSALSLAAGHPVLAERLRPHFTDQEWPLYTRRRMQEGPILTSSAGRLFDAVAALLGLAAGRQYEGEAAMRLEALAWEAPDTPPWTLPDLPEGPALPLMPLLDRLARDLQAGRPPAEIAAAFHATLIALVRPLARRLGVSAIGLSGGVWQNAFLTRCATEQLGPEFALLQHRQLSPNDENIAFGQLALYLARPAAVPNGRTAANPSFSPLKPQDYVPGHTW